MEGSGLISTGTIRERLGGANGGGGEGADISAPSRGELTRALTYV